jgi:hypothetical protein
MVALFSYGDGVGDLTSRVERAILYTSSTGTFTPGNEETI